MATNYTRLIEFKVKDTELNRAVGNLSKTLDKIDKTLVGIDKKLETIAKTRFKDIEKEAGKVEKSMLRIGKVYKKMLTPQGVARGAVSGIFGLIGLNKKAIVEMAAKIGFLDLVTRRFTKGQYGLGKAIFETTGAVKKAVSALDRYGRSATDLIRTHSRLIDATGKLGLALGTVAAFTPQIFAAGKAWRQLEYDIRRVGKAYADSGLRGVGKLFPAGSMIGKQARAGDIDFDGRKAQKKLEQEQLKAWRSMGEHPGNIKAHIEGLTKVNKILGDNQKLQEGINAFTGRHVQAVIATRKAQTAVNHELLRAKATQALFNADIWIANRAWKDLLNTLKTATGLLGKLSFGLFTGKTAGSIGQAAGIIGASRGIEDLIQKVPLLSQALKDNIQTFATWTRTVTEAVASVSIAYTGLSAALSAAKWVTGAITGFINWEKQAAQSIWNVQRGFNALDQRMAANLDANRNIATGFGGWIKNALTGGEERQEKKRTALQGPTTQQSITEEIRKQTQNLANRNTTAKDYVAIQRTIYDLERAQTREINMRRQMEVKAGKPIREVYESEVRAADEAIKKIDAMRRKSVRNAVAANDQINAQDKRAYLEKLKLEKESAAQKAKEVKLAQDNLATIKKHNWELRKARRLKRLEQRRERAARRSRLGENLMLGAGFPLLFGGGLGAVGGGVLGAGIQAQTGSKGFGMQILFSALGQQLDAVAARALQTAKAFTSLDGAFTLMNERTLWSSDAVQKQATALQKQGKNTELAALLTKEYAKILGSDGIRKMQELGEKSKEAAKQWGILRTQLELLLAGPLTDIMRWLNTFLTRTTTKKGLHNTYTRLRETGQEDKAAELLRAVQAAQVGGPSGFYSGKEGYRMGVEKSGGASGFDVGNVPTTDLQRINQRFSAFLPSTASIPSTGGDPTKGAELEATLKAEIAHLQKVGQLGRQEAEIRREINKLEDEGVKNAEKLVRQKYALTEQLQRTEALYGQIGAVIKDGIVDAIEGAIEGTKTLGDVASSVFRQIARMMLNYGISAGMKSIFPGMRASGGPVTGGKPYIVGEKGPELFTPGSSGKITPNHELGGGNVSVNVAVDASGTSAQGDQPSAQELGRLIGAAVQSELVRQKRPGGVLY